MLDLDGVLGEEEVARDSRAGVTGEGEAEAEAVLDRGDSAPTGDIDTGRGGREVGATRRLFRRSVADSSSSPNRVPISSGSSFSRDSAADTALDLDTAEAGEAERERDDEADTARRSLATGASGGMTTAEIFCTLELLRSLSLSLPPSLLVSSVLVSSSVVSSAPSNSDIRLRCTRLSLPSSFDTAEDATKELVAFIALRRWRYSA